MKSVTGTSCPTVQFPSLVMHTITHLICGQTWRLNVLVVDFLAGIGNVANFACLTGLDCPRKPSRSAAPAKGQTSL
jgi:hypothetical protein